MTKLDNIKKKVAPKKVVTKKVVTKKISPKKISPKKVLVGMSGGVDSSVAACLLKDQGYEVAGVFLHFWKDESVGGRQENRCCSLESLLDAKAVAAKIGIPLFTFDYSSEFKKEVVDNFLSEYQEGKTPNPCVVCNKKIKTARLLQQARALGFDYLATGHYLKIEDEGKEKVLLRAKDKAKDQTYFLYTMSQAELKHLLFPLGNYKKPQVRKLAEKYGLKVASKGESQDICFLAGDHNIFLKKYLKLNAGDIRILGTEEKIGEHLGLQLYTIGQRRGLVGGIGPFYVADFDYKNNILYVVKEWNDKILYKREFLVKNVNWLSSKPLKKKFKAQVVIRYGHKAVACEVLALKNKNTYQVIFNKPQRAVTPGQSAVFYDGPKVLGGGIIVL